MLDKSAGWDRLVSIAEENISARLNEVLNPEPGVDGLIKMLMQLGQIKGMKSMAHIVETELEVAEFDIERLGQELLTEDEEVLE